VHVSFRVPLIVFLFISACASPNQPSSQLNTATPALIDDSSILETGTSVLEEPQACPEAEGVPRSDDGLYSHQIYLASGSDPYTFVTETSPIISHASVPDVVIGPDGTPWIYFINANPGQHGIFIARETSAGWETFDCIRVDGLFEPNAVDPDLVRQSDGTYRLFYYLGQFVGPPSSNNDSLHPIYTLVSDDGIHFENEGLVFEEKDLTDPSAIQLPDGSWLMAVAQVIGPNEPAILITAGEDPLSFIEIARVTPAGIPELILLPDGDVRLYLNQRGGIISFISSDQGLSWQPESGFRLRDLGGLMADPSVIQSSETEWLMIWKGEE
jgi:hypothetical protein